MLDIGRVSLRSFIALPEDGSQTLPDFPAAAANCLPSGLIVRAYRGRVHSNVLAGPEVG